MTRGNNHQYTYSSQQITRLPNQPNPTRRFIDQRIPVDRFRPSHVSGESAFTKWMQDQRTEGKTLYAVNLTYCTTKTGFLTPAGAASRASHFYCFLLSELFHRRNYHAAQFRSQYPLMLLFLDRAGSKRKAEPKKTRSTNTASYHHHGFIAADPTISQKLTELAAAIGNGTLVRNLPAGIQSVLIKPVDDDIDGWRKYSTAFDSGDFLLFPKSQPEELTRLIGPPKPRKSKAQNH
jgi:hypothetical protein